MGVIAALAGCATLALGGLLAAGAGRLRVGVAVQATGMLVLGVVGIAVLTGDQALGSPFRSSIGPAFGLDQLSGFFLAVLAVTAVPTLLFARDYLPGSAGERGVGALTAGFLLSLVGVLTARDVTTFLAFWELMTLLPAAAILVAKRDASVRGAVYAYLAITHLGGAGVWIALLVLQHHGAIGDPSALAAAGTGAQTLVAITALIGFGTKAGFIPLHSWLPRAHPVAPAHLSALMSGMMIKVAIYGLIRVEFEWLGATPRWLGIALLLIGLISALGGVLWALVQHDLKRLLAYHSIENVGIIALGLGASLLFADAGAAQWAAIAFAAALLHVANHAIFKTLLFLGAGAFERAVGSLDLDHLGGLLRRMPWTGGAFLVGSMAIAGLPPLNGFASEWLTLQSLLHAAFYRPVAVALVAGAALAGLAATAALALLCFVKVVGLALLGAPRRPQCADATDPAFGMRAGMALLAVLCVLLGLVPGLIVSDARPSGARRRRRRTDAAARPAGARHGCLPGAGDRDRAGCPDGGLDAAARIAARRSGAGVGLWAGARAGAGLDVGGVHQAAATRARGGPATPPRARGRAQWRDGAEDHLFRPRPLARRHAAVRADDPRRAARRCGRPATADGERAHLRRVPARARARGARVRADGDLRMSALAAILQLLGVALAPLLPGSIQALKARLQGRRGPSPWQPYRTLRRLWGKSAVDPEGTGVVYRLAPPVVAACLLAALVIVPIAGRAGDFGLGHDALVLVGLLALARFALAAAAWDTGSGFALMGAARDLMIAVFGEALLVLALLVAALPAHSTDLRAMSAAASGGAIWSGPAHWCGAFAFALVILVETGRQPIDNPDTHLELTMIHEGPLLEYAGRDLAFIQWAAAARHWVAAAAGRGAVPASRACVRRRRRASGRRTSWGCAPRWR